MVIVTINFRLDADTYVKLGRLAKEYSEASATAKQIRVSPDFNEDDDDEIAAEELVSRPFLPVGLFLDPMFLFKTCVSDWDDLSRAEHNLAIIFVFVLFSTTDHPYPDLDHPGISI